VQACSSLATPAEREPWARALLQQCEARLAAAGGAALADERALRVCAIAVGEVALVAPRAVTPALVASLQALTHGGGGGGGGGGGAAPASRAAAFVALGKVCMGSVEVAQRLLPVFMTALTSHEDAAVRSNALVILFDLAKRHTALLERHFSTMALSLYDSAASVRHSAPTLTLTLTLTLALTLTLTLTLTRCATARCCSSASSCSRTISSGGRRSSAPSAPPSPTSSPACAPRRRSASSRPGCR